jgi:endoglucanase
MRSRLVFLLPYLGLLEGCLTTPASETGGTKRARVLVPRDCGPNALIDDGEDGDNRILVRDDRGGYWFTSIDAAGSTMQPAGSFSMGSPGHAGSQHAAHMQGQMGTTGDSFWASIGFGFMDPQAPYDASRYSGITFWAKGPAHIRLKLPDAYTAPAGGHCQDCYNDFGIELALTAKWERYTIPFEALAQQPNWGDPRPQVASNELFGVQWQFGTPGRAFDIWIDDIAFFCGTEGSSQ